MEPSNVSANETDPRRSAPDVDQMLAALRRLWYPHRENGLRVRHAMGLLLNKQLGDPSDRQKRGLGIVALVSTELGIDKSDISRMRRFAARFESFDEFCRSHPTMATWSMVRGLLNKPPRTLTDDRQLWGLLRSARTATASLQRVACFDGPKADELRVALLALFKVAQAKLDIRLDEVDSANDALITV